MDWIPEAVVVGLIAATVLVSCHSRPENEVNGQPRLPSTGAWRGDSRSAKRKAAHLFLLPFLIFCSIAAVGLYRADDGGMLTSAHLPPAFTYVAVSTLLSAWARRTSSIVPAVLLLVLGLVFACLVTIWSIGTIGTKLAILGGIRLSALSVLIALLLSRAKRQPSG